MKKAIFSKKFRDACVFVSEQVYGPKGVLAYHFFDFINDHYFANRLPTPYIIWGLTAHGGCVAWASTAQDRSRPPIITLHPSLMEEGEEPNPWGLPSEWLGPAMVFDTLLHECIHVHIGSNLGGTKGRSSHDCKRWVRQVNRIAPLLGFEDVEAGQTKLMRVPIRGAPRTPRGKLPTRVVRRTLGNVPFHTVAGFPRSLREHLRQASEHYRRNQLPRGLVAIE